MIGLHYKEELYYVEPLSIFLNAVGITTLIASLGGDGLMGLVVGILVFILDELKFPYPNIERDNSGADDDLGGEAVEPSED